MIIYKITPKIECTNCHGTGELVDWVNYGSTTVPMYSICERVGEQVPEEFDMYDEVELVVCYE